MSMKDVSHQLELLCQVKHMFIFEYQVGSFRKVIPVITEHVRTSLNSSQQGQYEFFRARATHDHAITGDFHPYHNSVSVTLCHVTKQIKIGPTGELIMGTQGIRLGPSLMSCVLTWLKKQRVDDYTIDPGTLSRVDAETTKDREQRNRFYMAFGFTLHNWDKSITGLDVVDGAFTAENVGALSVPERYQNMLQPWKAFHYDLQFEREIGVSSLCELRDIDQWTHSKSWVGRWLLRRWGWPVRFLTRHLHPRNSWESK
ncbi:hypothetical protein I9018_31345 [Pseudomonas sp. MPFS]|uniref:hypothetical protein n=1 Tax=Pseudomonas sp. MPFS TaxID=2795724 RepID=UPI001F148BF2|nr:hypothetical protein [Pseudomonas sp. MPFS]UMZ11910.1 hypothetical protein I9018_31345 [Pseudomonas sp. MPFS]